MKNKKIFITGIAGFIGFSLAKKISDQYPDVQIIGIDNLNDYYSVKLKLERLKELKKYENISFLEGDISDLDFLTKTSSTHRDIELIFHFAAQAGIRHSIEEPLKYVSSNLMGQVCILEFAKSLPNLEKIIYASSSSVYGNHKETPYKESLPIEKPLSLYSATKQADELICSSYSRLFNIPMIGLRLFTAYGPYGRPDMAIYKIANLIKNNKIVELVGEGKITRDFTYIDDITSAVISAANYTPEKDESGFQNEIFNLGSGKKIDLNQVTSLIEKYLNIDAKIKYIKTHASDMQNTLADISKAAKYLDYFPKIEIDQGIKYFVDWYINQK